MKRYIVQAIFWLIIFSGLGCYIDMLLREEIVTILQFTLRAVGYLVAGTLAISCLFFVFLVRERLYMKRAERKRLEREANLLITIAPPGMQVYRTVTGDYEVVTTPLHLEAGWANGESEPVTILQQQRWLVDKAMSAQRSSVARHMLTGPEDTFQDNRPLQSVIEVIKHEPCVAIWGGRGAGKTTHALHWLAHCRSENYVVDPKPLGLNHWPSAKVIGSSGQFGEVEPAIERIYNELLHRQAHGLLNEPPITLLVDELYTLIHVHKLAIMEWVFAIITLGREWGVNASFTSSAKGVKVLGIEGMSGLAEALTFVHLTKVGGIHKCFVDFGEGEIEVKPCGPYIPSDHTPRQIPGTIPMTEEEAIRQAVMDNSGASYGEIIRLVNVGGSRPTATKRVKEVIETFGLEAYNIGGKFPIN